MRWSNPTHVLIKYQTQNITFLYIYTHILNDLLHSADPLYFSIPCYLYVDKVGPTSSKSPFQAKENLFCRNQEARWAVSQAPACVDLCLTLAASVPTPPPGLHTQPTVCMVLGESNSTSLIAPTDRAEKNKVVFVTAILPQNIFYECFKFTFVPCFFPSLWP